LLQHDVLFYVPALRAARLGHPCYNLTSLKLPEHHKACATTRLLGLRLGRSTRLDSRSDMPRPMPRIIRNCILPSSRKSRKECAPELINLER
jgi:hypothetical protein